MIGQGTRPSGLGRLAFLHRPHSLLRNILRAGLLACFALLLGATGLAQDDTFDWDQEFPYPVYVVHISMTGTMYGPQERDVYILFPSPPDENGILLTADGSGGFFINEAELFGGPYSTPREVCNAVRGTPAENFDMGQVPQLPWFHCLQLPDTEDCAEWCKQYHNPNSSGTLIDGKCSCTCNPGYEPDENLICVPTKAKCDQDCREYHGTSKIHGPEAYGKVENGICNCYCKDGYAPDDTLTCVKVEKKSCEQHCREQLGAGGMGTGEYPDCNCSCEPPYQPQPVNGRCVEKVEEKKSDKPYCGDGTCDVRLTPKDDRVLPENCERCEPDCNCASRLDGTSCNPSHPDATIDNWGCVKIVAVVTKIGSKSGIKPYVLVTRLGTSEPIVATEGTPLNDGDRVTLQVEGRDVEPYVIFEWSGGQKGLLRLADQLSHHSFEIGENLVKSGWPEPSQVTEGANLIIQVWTIASESVLAPIVGELKYPTSQGGTSTLKVRVESHVVIEQGTTGISIYTIEGKAVVEEGDRSATVTDGMKTTVSDGSIGEPVLFGPGELDERAIYEPWCLPGQSLDDGECNPWTTGEMEIGGAIWGVAAAAAAILAILLAAVLFFAWRAANRRRPAPAVAPVMGAGTVPVGQRTVRRPAEPPGNAWGVLSVIQGQALPKTLNLERPVITIGRDPASDLVLQDNLASRRHAQIRREEGEAVLHDLKSVNGTFVNRVRITGPWPIRPGDVIHLGRTGLVFEAGSPHYRPAVPDDRLVPTQGGSEPPALDLRGKPLFQIGREPGNDLVITDDPFVSRQHAQIEQTQHGHEIVDLNSTHGVLVNGQRVSRAALRPGDRVRLGNSEFTYQG